MSITTHILDISLGRPAGSVSVRLERWDAGAEWIAIGEGLSDDNGRVSGLISGDDLSTGLYRLVFDTGSYYLRTERTCFFPEVDIVFTVADAGEHYHVPLLISPFGYSTYRGS